jgi:hypothetical protein
MSTLHPPISPTARTTVNFGRFVLSALQTLSGLAVVIGTVIFLLLNDGTGGVSSSLAGEQPRPQASAFSPGSAIPPQLMFYLVATQAEADLVAAEDYDNWASGDRGASEKRVHILFARNPAEEPSVHQVILREIGAARTPPIVTIVDRRSAD